MNDNLINYIDIPIILLSKEKTIINLNKVAKTLYFPKTLPHNLNALADRIGCKAMIAAIDSLNLGGSITCQSDENAILKNISHWKIHKFPEHEKASYLLTAYAEKKEFYIEHSNEHEELEKLSQQFMGVGLKQQNTQFTYTKSMINFIQTMIWNMPGIVYWKDLNGVFMGCNDNTVRLAGMATREDVIGKTDYDFEKLLNWPKGTAAKFRKTEEEIIKTGKPSLNHEEDPFPPTPQTKRMIQLSNRVPLKDLEGKIIGTLGISIDITDRKHNEQLEREKKQAEQEIALLETLSGSIAHELRTPLAAIIMSMDGLLKSFPALLAFYEQALIEKKIDHPLPERNLTYLRGWEAGIRPLVKSARTTLDMFLVNMQQNEFNSGGNLQLCSMKKAVNLSLEKYPFFDEAERDFIKWDPSIDFTYCGEYQLTHHILWNLMRNALYYIKAEKKGEISIYLECQSNANYLHFKDTACGIPPEILSQIFDRFYSTRLSGTGLGLTLCDLAMKNFHGKISCRSKVGEYTHFILEFPKID